MRYVKLEDTRPGMQLAYGLYDSSGRTLVSQNALLTQNYIDKLKEYGFGGVYITDELSKDIHVEATITPALRTEGLMCVRESNIDKCQKIASKIVEEILTRGKLTLDLTDLRSFDDYTYAHSVNVAVISCVIGFGLKLNEENLQDLVTAALLHDLGKLSIPQEILNKPGRLTQEEYQIMKSHPLLSYEMIKERWDLSAQIKIAVLYHHENVDGSGYPEGLEGIEQTLFTRILHVADVYDALVSRRPYKEPYSPYEASEYLMGGSGIMFDRHVVATLLKYVPLYPKGKQISLSDGRIGIIMDNSDYHNLRPVVKLMDGTVLDLAERENYNITVKKAVGEEFGENRESEEARKKMIQPFKRYKLVVVDDMKTNLEALRGILEHLYDVILLKSGRQALLYLEKNEYPDLILMDIDMPEMDGVETARKIKEMTKDRIPILFVTALSDKETVMMCRRINAAGYILRPYNPVFVKSEIKRILTGRSDSE